MLRLWVKDNTNGTVHEYGTSCHDSLVLQENGSLHYENLQCCASTEYPEEGYSFCREDGTVPDISNTDIGDEYLDIGGCFYQQANNENGLILTIDGATGYFPKEFIINAIRDHKEQRISFGNRLLKDNAVFKALDFCKFILPDDVTERPVKDSLLKEIYLLLYAQAKEIERLQQIIQKEEFQ